jgi:hypothetical protein
MNRIRIVVATLAVLTLLAVPVSASGSTVVVHPGDMQGWAFFPEAPINTQSGQMVNGPGTPPLGTGSAQLAVEDGGGMALGTDHGAVRLDAIDTLRYSTYRVSGGAAPAIALQLNVDYDLTDANEAWQGRLVYEPYHANSAVTGEWQTWNPLVGSGWWSTQTGHTTCTQANHCTLAQVLEQKPHAGIHATLGAVILKAGSNWSGFVGNVDALTLNSTTWDFELEAPAPTDPATKDDCKNGGWESFGFRNQGQCIQFVNTGKDSRA